VPATAVPALPAPLPLALPFPRATAAGGAGISAAAIFVPSSACAAVVSAGCLRCSTGTFELGISLSASATSGRANEGSGHTRFFAVRVCPSCTEAGPFAPRTTGAAGAADAAPDAAPAGRAPVATTPGVAPLGVGVADVAPLGAAAATLGAAAAGAAPRIAPATIGALTLAAAAGTAARATSSGCDRRAASLPFAARKLRRPATPALRETAPSVVAGAASGAVATGFVALGSLGTSLPTLPVEPESECALAPAACEVPLGATSFPRSRSPTPIAATINRQAAAMTQGRIPRLRSLSPGSSPVNKSLCRTGKAAASGITVPSFRTGSRRAGPNSSGAIARRDSIRNRSSRCASSSSAVAANLGPAAASASTPSRSG
jgi:hypothetical protein